MKRANKFIISPTWALMLSDMGIDVNLALQYAKLPADFFHQDNASLSPAGYFQLWLGIEKAAGEKDIPLLLAKHMTVETFDAPFFAAICSNNLNMALNRLKQYKPLIGPMLLGLKETVESTQVTISCYGYTGKLPACLGLTEAVFFTQLARLATREYIRPKEVLMAQLPADVKAYEDYFGCKVKQGKEYTLTFTAEDANLPFLTRNAAMWEFFEAKLNQKLADLDTNASTVDRVRAVLFEALPGGQSSIEYVASNLAMSKRSLQRKLTAEAESFQSVLQAVRGDLADHYLERSEMSLGEISFLLGFQEPNSFIRAYSAWKGISPGSFRDMQH